MNYEWELNDSFQRATVLAISNEVTIAPRYNNLFYSPRRSNRTRRESPTFPLEQLSKTMKVAQPRGRS